MLSLIKENFQSLIFRLSEAESVLTGGDILNSKTLEKVVSDFGDQASFALQLLGKICTQTERGSCAAEAYSKVNICSFFLSCIIMFLTNDSIFQFCFLGS